MKKVLLLSASIFTLFSSAIAQLPTTTPHAPDVDTEYLGNGVISITLSNDNPESNNYLEGFSVYDELAADYWEFEGYKVYQVDIPISDIDFSNVDEFRLITGGQSDIENEHSNLINHEFDPNIGECVPTQMVDGANLGLNNVYTVDTDAFTGQPFVEGEFYCFVAIAYAVNPNGQSEGCTGLSQYIESSDAADGDIVIQCSTVSVGIVEPIQDVSFKMFPNPSSEFLTIEMNKMASVEVLNITGELIYQNATQNSDVTKLKVSDWGRGIYLVSATDEFGNRRTKRLEVY